MDIRYNNNSRYEEGPIIRMRKSYYDVVIVIVGTAKGWYEDVILCVCNGSSSGIIHL